MNCPGSVALLKHLDLGESDEPDYRREGTALHEASAYCLDNGLDAWEVMHETFNNTVIDQSFATPIQVYLDTVRPDLLKADEYFVETSLSSPAHKDMYGSLDFGAVLYDDFVGNFLDVTDLKGGEGIIVEPDDNPQLKYYGFLLIDQHPEWPDTMRVRIRIVQPRAYHQLGVVREWWTTIGEIKAWVRDTLVPAMDATEYDHTLDAGPHCRFCPAKLVCPMLTSLFAAACKANPKDVPNLDDVALGRSYKYTQAVKFYLKAMEEEALKRLNLGRKIDGTKLVLKKANRVWKDGAAALAQARFGAQAMTEPEIKTPAALEKIGKDAGTFAKEHAYQPQTGYTVALEGDPRPAVRVQTSTEAFGGALANLG